MSNTSRTTRRIPTRDMPPRYPEASALRRVRRSGVARIGVDSLDALADGIEAGVDLIEHVLVDLHRGELVLQRLDILGDAGLHLVELTAQRIDLGLRVL